MTRTDRQVKLSGYPDWNASKEEKLYVSSETAYNKAGSKTLTENGYLVFKAGDGSDFSVTVNDVTVANMWSSIAGADVSTVIPVSVGDEVTWPKATLYTGSASAILVFYPCK